MDINHSPDDYFIHYENLEVHKLMLEDKSRTDTYKKAILHNEHYFKDKIIMDVGCGTGILSLFCAQAGAKKVYAIEASNLAFLAKEVIAENNFTSIIEVIHNKVEDVILPDNVKVDVIVSEWMGFYLLHEGMLDSVLVARDKFLKEDGVMFPESATIYVAPCSVPSYYEKWNDFSGVSLLSFAKHLRKEKLQKPEIMQVSKDDLLAPEIAVAWINIKEDSSSELDSYSIEHVFGVNKSGNYQGVCIWFECTFPQLTNEVITLSTHPASPLTHWKQTVILLPETQTLEEQEPIAFRLDVNRDELNNRRYKLALSLLDPDEVEHPIPCSCYMTKCILVKTVMLQQAGQTAALNDNENGVLQEDDLDDDSE